MSSHPAGGGLPYGRLIAIFFLLVIIAFLAALFAVPTLLLHEHYDELLEDYSDKLTRYQRVAALQPSIEATLAEVTKQAGGKYYLHATAPNLAAAELQSMATRIVEKHRGRILSSRTHSSKSDTKNHEPIKVSMDIHFAASIIPLQLILHEIETHTPYFFIEKTNITSTHGRNSKIEPGVQPEFDIQLTIAGYMLPGGVQP